MAGDRDRRTRVAGGGSTIATNAKCILAGGTNDQPIAGSTNFIGLVGLNPAVTAESILVFAMPFACIARNMQVVNNNPMVAGSQCTATLRKTKADTAIVAVVPAATPANTTTPDNGASVAFAKGDLVSVKIVQTATAPTSAFAVSLEIDPQ